MVLNIPFWSINSKFAPLGFSKRGKNCELVDLIEEDSLTDLETKYKLFSLIENLAEIIEFGAIDKGVYAVEERLTKFIHYLIFQKYSIDLGHCYTTNYKEKKLKFEKEGRKINGLDWLYERLIAFADYYYLVYTAKDTHHIKELQEVQREIFNTFEPDLHDNWPKIKLKFGSGQCVNPGDTK